MRYFVTVFYPFEESHLVKDVNLLGYSYSKKYNYTPVIVGENNPDKFSKELKNFPNLLFEKVPKIDHKKKILGVNFETLKYLWSIRETESVICFFHFRIEYFYYFLFIRLFIPGFKIVQKLDLNVKEFERKGGFFDSKYKINRWRLAFYEFFILKLTHLVTVESDSGKSALKKRYNRFAEKFFTIRNGLCEIKRDFSTVKKENLMITVGRIGTYQKNIEFLLKALDGMELKDWSVKIIGPVNNEFRDVFDRYLFSNKDHVGKVELTGSITDREELYAIYAKSKVMLLTSRFEGFPIVFPEALAFGNYILTTEVSGSKDICNNKVNGKEVRQGDIIAYKKSLVEIIKGENSYIEKVQERKNNAEIYKWDNISEKLHLALEQI